MEQENVLPFLDVNVFNNGDGFETGVYRKSTFTGLLTKYDSQISQLYKTNLISCLVDRAFKLSSNYFHFTCDLDNIRGFLCKNRFPLDVIEKCFRSKITLLYENRTVLTVAKKKIFCSIPYISRRINNMIRVDVNRIVTEFYPHINCNVIFKNDCTISSYFSHKDTLETSMRSNVVYGFSCSQCNATYVGETSRHLKTRIAEHRGISVRTSRPLSNCNSIIFKHSMENSHPVKPQDFKILGNANSHNIRTLESIYIYKNKPNLNRTESSIPLNILI